jgi:hypothetical protein
MTEPTPAAPPPQQAPRKASRKRIILMMVLGGPVLAFGGCMLFLSGMNFNTGNSDTPLSALGAIGFVAGAIGFIWGVLWGLARWVDRRFDKSAGKV